MKHSRSTVTGLAVLALLAACGGERTQPDAAQPAAVPELATPICEHVTVDELRLFTGREYQAGEVTAAQANMHRCLWRPVEDEGNITLTVHPDAGQAQQGYLDLPGMETLTGVPGEAWWSHTVQTFVMRLGNQLIVIGFDTSDTTHRQIGEQIATRAAERLG